MSDRKQIINDIRTGEIDINNQSLFFPIVIKGLLVKLNEQLAIRGVKIPHFIIHTGDDTMYLSVKGQDASIEPLEISNENYVYNSIPRCIVTVSGMNIETDQLTNPYTHGQMQYESEDSIYTFLGEFRRVPIKLTVSCKYYVDSWGDLMELTQYIISKLAFIQTYTVSYMGQAIRCSYAIPTSMDGEYTAELDGTTQDNKARTTEISLEIETNFPVWECRTIMSTEDRITKTAFINTFNKDLHNKINPYIIERSFAEQDKKEAEEVGDEEAVHEAEQRIKYDTAEIEKTVYPTRNSKHPEKDLGKLTFDR